MHFGTGNPLTAARLAVAAAAVHSSFTPELTVGLTASYQEF